MWVARNKNGTLCIFYHKTWREYDSCWGGYSNNQMVIPETLFPNLKWEEEPLEVELVSKSELTSLKMLAALYREEHSENLFISEDDDKSCTNCKFKNDYPKCYKNDNIACEDWTLFPRMHKIDCIIKSNKKG